MNDRNVSESSITLSLRPRTVLESLDFWRIVNVCERLFAFFVFAALLPVLLVSSLIVAVLSGRVPFIAHRRVGRYGSEIWVVKLRTMWDGRTSQNMVCTLFERIYDSTGGRPFVKTCRDPRIASSFAAFLRRHSIDELPQLWQVVCGQLALVGPRPITWPEIDEYYGPDSTTLLSRKPGITGLWQVCGRSRLSYPQRRRLDLFMLQKWSLSLYLLILVRTIHRAPIGKDAW
jgi:lipopolysaccharide/colanic/teichoic acid biosynthesis glycosyltransferase